MFGLDITNYCYNNCLSQSEGKKRQILFRDTISMYCENLTQHIMHYVDNMHILYLLAQVIVMVTTGFKRRRNHC